MAVAMRSCCNGIVRSNSGGVLLTGRAQEAEKKIDEILGHMLNGALYNIPGLVRDQAEHIEWSSTASGSLCTYARSSVYALANVILSTSADRGDAAEAGH